MPRPLPHPRTAVVLTALAIAALAGTGCGLRPDDKPQVISQDQLDPALFGERSQTTVASGSTMIYVIDNQGRDQRLERIPVQIDTGDRYRSLLQALLAWSPPSGGPNARLSSLIPSGTTLKEVRRDGDLLTVDLSNLSVEGPGQAAAVAQIVYTATDLPGIRWVKLLINGKPVAVPLDDKSSETGAHLGRADLPGFDPGRPADAGDPPGTTASTEPTTTTPAPAGVGIR